MGKMCKRMLVTFLAFVLCMQTVTPVMAAPGETALMSAVAKTPDMSGGMQPFDMSEEAIAASQVSVEEFMEKHGVTEEQLSASELEMQQELGLIGMGTDIVLPEGVSANSTAVLPERAGVSYATLEDAAAYLRGKMVKRREEVSIRVAGSKDSALKKVRTILSKVYEYDINGNPEEGDYLYWHTHYMEWTTPQKNSDGTHTIHFWFHYRTSAEEEKYVDRKVNSIISKLNLKSVSLSEYQKVRAIYDYIMSIIEYDYFHYENDQNYMPMYTAYEALNSGYAVCQAYATLFYRLCEEVDISARVICGIDDEDGNPTHGWNIVKIGNDYYNLDATWDDSDTPTHIYFLKNRDDFLDHQRNAMHTGRAFDKKFPMAEVSYPTPESDVKNVMIDMANISGSVKLIDGTDYSLEANGKPKVIFFMDAEDCLIGWVEKFYALKAVQSKKCDALFVDIFDEYEKYKSDGLSADTIMEMVMSFTDKPYLYNFSSDLVAGLSYKEQYAALTGMPSGCYSSFAIIDENNRIRFFGTADLLGFYGDKILAEIVYKGTSGNVSGIGVSQTSNNKVKITWQAYSGADGYRVVFDRIGKD